MGTPEFATPILSIIASDRHEIVAIYTQPDKPQGRGKQLTYPPVKTTAQTHGLPIFQPLTLKHEAERISDMQPEVIIVAAFAKLLPKSILNIPKLGCLNVHPSLLPRHRGSSPVAAAILAGDEITGVTIMLLDEGMDTGPILSQKQVPVLPQDTTGSLTSKLAELGADLLLDTLHKWSTGEITPHPQDNEIATYAGVIDKNEGEISWRLPAIVLSRRVRAFQPWPGCYTRWQGKLLKIIEANHLNHAQQAEVGQVITINQEHKTGIGVQTSEGILQLLSIQPEGKNAMTVDAFQRGQREFIGSLLPC